MTKTKPSTGTPAATKAPERIEFPDCQETHEMFAILQEEHAYTDVEQIAYIREDRDNWISVEDDRKPAFGEEILVFTNNPMPGFQPIYVTMFGLVKPDGFVDGITHWQPLPQPPKQ